MNLIEAINTGKPFQLAGSSERALVLWQDPQTGDAYLATNSNWSDRRHVTCTDIARDDWEIQEPTVTITKSQFYKALKDSLSDAGWEHAPPQWGGGRSDWTLDHLARKLGLE